MPSFEITDSPRAGDFRDAEDGGPVRTCLLSLQVKNLANEAQTASLYVLTEVADAAGVFASSPAADIRFIKDQRFEAGETQSVTIRFTLRDEGRRRYSVRVAAARRPDADFTDSAPVELTFKPPPKPVIEKLVELTKAPAPFSLPRVIGSGLRLVARNAAGAAGLTAIFALPATMLAAALGKTPILLMLPLLWCLVGSGVLQVYFARRAPAPGAIGSQPTPTKTGVMSALAQAPRLAFQMPALAAANLIGLIIVRPLCLAVAVPVEVREQLGFVKAAARSVDLTAGRLGRAWLLLALQVVGFPALAIVLAGTLGKVLPNHAQDFFAILVIVASALSLGAAFAVAYYLEARRVEETPALRSPSEV